MGITGRFSFAYEKIGVIRKVALRGPADTIASSRRRSEVYRPEVATVVTLLANYRAIRDSGASSGVS
jgi:hypothetical protein